MTTAALERRVDTLEEYMKELSYQSLRTEMELARLSKEMRGFKKEMREQTREMNRQWGALSNKLGTLVEDLVAPSLSRVIQQVLGLEVLDLSIRRKRRLPDGQVQEFDAIAVTAEVVCLNSTKTTLRGVHVDAMAGEIERLRLFFPEYRDTPIVGVLASLGVEESVVNDATKQGFIVLATGDQLMEVMNPAGFVPKRLRLDENSA